MNIESIESTATSRTALITGASRGLGLALARSLAGDGWNLIIDARGAPELESARAELVDIGKGKVRVHALAGDVSDPSHLASLAEAARQVGGLDVLVNNASVLGPSPQPSLLDYPLNALLEVYRANTIAPLALIQILRDVLHAGARIVNVTSDAAVESYEGWGGYGSSKAALEQLSNILAAEEPGWRVYWVDPGDMRTALHQLAFPGEDISDRPLPEVSVPGLRRLLMGELPSGRYRARDVASESDTESESSESSGSSHTVRELRVALTVKDFEAALRLYRDGLRLETVKDWNTPEGRGTVLSAGPGTIELLDEADAEHTDAVEAGRRVSGPVRLALRVENVGEVATALLQSGASAVGEPVQTSWGNPSQRLQAPDGMQLTLFQLPPAGEEP